MDKLSAEQRHKNMAAIHSKDTKPEMIVRMTEFSTTFRFYTIANRDYNIKVIMSDFV